MSKTHCELPARVFTVVCRDERYVCISAELTARRGSWWYVTHADGSVTKHNGGSPWRHTIPEAWFRAMRKMAWTFWQDGVAFALKEARPGIAARDANLERLFEDMWDCASACGELSGVINAAQKAASMDARGERREE